MKKSLLILALFIMCLPVTAEPYRQGGYAGTPPNFYEDINPDSLDEENEYEYPKSSSETSARDYERNSSFDYSQPKATKDYAAIYNNLEPASFSYLHGIDPDEYYDVKDAAWSIYPLLRLNSAIFFKNIVIEPGYYLLTPREHEGKWYILFKQNGKVAYIIPVYERGYTPERFYDEHIPKPKLKTSQKIHMKILEVVGKTKSSKRREPVKSFLEINDLDNYFIDIIIYYGGHKYSTIFRTIRL